MPRQTPADLVERAHHARGQPSRGPTRERERYRKWFEASGHFPRSARLTASGLDPDDPDTRDERFQFSLDCVLDGIAVRLGSPIQ